MRRVLLPASLFLAACGGAEPAPAPVIVAPVPTPPPAPISVPEIPEPWETETDPVQRRTLKESAWLRSHPALEGKEVRIHDLRPFLVAEVVVPGRPEPPSAVGPMLGRVLPGVHDAMRAFLKEVAGLDAPRVEELGDERLRWIVLPSREGFDDWHRLQGRTSPARGYFRPGGDSLAITCVDFLEPRGAARVACAQLLFRWRRHFVQEDDDAKSRARGEPREPVTAEDPRIETAHSWFDWGLYSWFAEGRMGRGPDPKWQPGLPAMEDYAFIRNCRGAGRIWPLQDLLFASAGQIDARSRMKEEGNARDLFVALHGSQARLLVDTLLDPEGPWRAGFGALVRSEVCGYSGRVYLCESFGLPRRTDDPRVAKWIAGLESACLARLDAGPPAMTESAPK